LLQCIIWGTPRASTGGMDVHASKAVELQRRLIGFAGQIVSLSFKLRRTAVGRHIANQMVRSGTATAANYAEARAAESRSDFIHKLRIVLKELNETDVWLQLIVETSLVEAPVVAGIVAENQELCRIFAASIKTAREFQPRR
jgi:four helix bundle protein